MSQATVVEVANDAPEGGTGAAMLAAIQHLILRRDNATFSSGAIAHGTTATDVKTTATVTYLIDGVFKSLAATDDFWQLTGDVLSAGDVQRWLLCVDASGTASVVEGNKSDSVAGVTFSDVTASDGHVYPSPGPSLAVVGILSVTVNSSTFTPGTTALTAGTITVAYLDGYDPAAIGANYPVIYGR